MQVKFERLKFKEFICKAIKENRRIGNVCS
jgi:hypothetical protein